MNRVCVVLTKQQMKALITLWSPLPSNSCSVFQLHDQVLQGLMPTYRASPSPPRWLVRWEAQEPFCSTRCLSTKTTPTTPKQVGFRLAGIFSHLHEILHVDERKCFCFEFDLTNSNKYCFLDISFHISSSWHGKCVYVSKCQILLVFVFFI